MFCTNCGNQLPDAAARCLKCGADQGQVAVPPIVTGPNPDNYLVAAVLLSLCWCTPLGLVALVYAGKGSGAKEAGNTQMATELAEKARLWTWIAFGAGALIWVGYALIVMLGVLSEAGSW
jgi:hypothetical protein